MHTYNADICAHAWLRYVIPGLIKMLPHLLQHTDVPILMAYSMPVYMPVHMPMRMPI